MLEVRRVVLALVTCISLVGISWGQSQPPPPSAGQIERGPPQKESAGKEQKASDQQRGTENAPFVVKVLPSGEAEQKAKDASDKKPSEATHDWRLSTADTIAVFIAIATFLQFVALVATITHLRRTERAYVSGGGYFPGEPGEKSEEFHLKVNNYGKTPAFVTHIDIGYLRWSGFLPDPPPPPTRRYALGMTVPPGKEELQTDVKLHRVRDIGASNDVIFGRFWYEDIFAKRWWLWPVWRRNARRIRTSGFVLSIDERRVVLPLNGPPRAYTDWT